MIMEEFENNYLHKWYLDCLCIRTSPWYYRLDSYTLTQTEGEMYLHATLVCIRSNGSLHDATIHKRQPFGLVSLHSSVSIEDKLTVKLITDEALSCMLDLYTF